MTTYIKILGAGCAKCKQSARLVEQVIAENKLDAEVEKVEDILEIMKYNILSTPTIVVNEEVKIKGKVPTKEEILALFN